MKDLFAAGDLKKQDIDLLQNRFLNRSLFGIVLIEGVECRLCFSHFPAFGPGDKLANGIGYLCIFEGSFLSGLLRKRVFELPMFTSGTNVVYILAEEDNEKAGQLFEKMIDEQDSSYQYKYDLIRTYLTQLLHLAMRRGSLARYPP